MASQSLKNVMRLIDQAKENLSPEEAFLNDLKASIEKVDSKNKHKPSKTYKPSSLQCIRNMYFQVSGAECSGDRNTSELVGICESGTDRHERIQQYVCDMKKSGIDCEYINVSDYVKSRNLDYLDIVSNKKYETKLYHKTLNMSFLCDGIIRYKGHYYILEIKTESIYKWQNRKDVAEEHKNQATAYSTALNIDNVLFLYECRDNCSKKCYLFNVTDDMKTELVGKIEECDGYVKRMICPPKPKDLPKKVCAYCNYKNLCKQKG